MFYLPEFMAFASRCFLYLIPLLLLPVSDVVAQNITLGESLTAALDQNSSWKSPSGDFAFGFQQIEPGQFVLAIWFDKIPEKTVTWSAGGENKIQTLQEGSRIELTTDGRFILSDREGKETWAAPLSGSGGTVSHAAMLDTGNFVLASQDSSNLWESFDEPTDTILPTQIMKLDTNLVARYSERNFSYGRFLFAMQTDGNLVLYTRKFPLVALNKDYWETSTDVSGGFQVVFNQSGAIYVEARNGSVLKTVTSSGVSSREYYQRGIFEYDGVFRHYIYPKNTSVSAGKPTAWSWQSAPVPENICTSIVQDLSPGACGYNSYCVLGDDRKPKCECPYGYKLLDPNNEMNGCKQDFAPQECDGGQDAGLFVLREMANTNWATKDYEKFDSVDEDWCRQSCLTDCFCAVAVHNNINQCWKKNIPFSNGVQDTSNAGTKTLVKIRTANSTLTTAGGSSDQKNQSSLNLILTALLSSSAFLNLMLLIAILWVVLSLRYRPRRMVQDLVAIKGAGLRSFSYKELEEASNKFKEELGKGACSTVYKAILNDKSVVAVKRLDKMVTDSEQEFQAEMNAIGKTNHKNLVQLIGFCNEGQHRILVYEYMRNGSLASYLFGDSRPGWYRRAEIAVGTARGLVYLHEECSNQIIHCDIKPQNILLDDSCKARISDFGLAKLLKSDQTRTLTAIRGTKGYVAPEWFKNMPVTAKVDVYSFGILLLELICCRKAFDQDVENEFQMILADWAYDCYEERTLYQLVQEDEEAMQDIKRVEIFVMIAIWCIQDNPSLRPTMQRVSLMLEGDVEVPLPPKNPHSSSYFLSSKVE